MMADAAAAFGEYVKYLSSMIEERRQAYRRGAPVPDDVISILLGADEDGVLESNEELTQDELSGPSASVASNKAKHCPRIRGWIE